MKIKKKKEIFHFKTPFIFLLKGADPLISCIQILKIPPEFRSKKLLDFFANMLESLNPFHDYLREMNEISLKKILLELAKIFQLAVYKENTVIYKVGEKINKFTLILFGKVAQLGIKYEKIPLTGAAFQDHMKKLAALKENFLLNECFKNNQKFFSLQPEVYEWYQKELKTPSENVMSQEHFKSLDEYMTLTSHSHYLIKQNNSPLYSFIIPSYYIRKIMQTGDFIGNFTNRKESTIYHSYFSMDLTDITYIEKNDKIYNIAFALLDSINKKKINEVIYSFYIFQDTDKKSIEANISKFLINKKCSKGDYLYRQGELFDGMYLVKRGIFEISTERSYLEISELIANIKESLFYFGSRSPSFQKFEKIPYPKDNFSPNILFHTKEFTENTKKKRKIFLKMTKSKNIIGITELFHSKIEMCLFNVQCLSEVGEVYFIPKHFFFEILNFNEIMMEKCATLTQQRVQFFVNILLKYKEDLMAEIQKLYAKNLNSQRKLVKIKRKSSMFPKILRKTCYPTTSIGNFYKIRESKRDKNFCKSKSASRIDSSILLNRSLIELYKEKEKRKIHGYSSRKYNNNSIL